MTRREVDPFGRFRWQTRLHGRCNMPLTDWRVYRVIGVTDESNWDSLNYIHNPNFILSTSAPSYCEPGIAFWLSSHIENPKSECILLEFRNIHIDPEHGSAEFEWDGGRYIGSYELRDDKPALRWADGQICDAVVCKVSSL